MLFSTFKGARLASAKAEADSLRVKHLSVLSLAEKHAHYEKIIAKLQFAAIVEDDTSETDLAKQETTRKVLSEIDNVVAQNKLEVDWNGWQLRVLPENFGQMHSLVHLNLSENFLEVRTLSPYVLKDVSMFSIFSEYS